MGAASVDHLEQLDAEGVAVIAASSTVATLLPAPAMVLRDRMPPARELLDAGAQLALASDANAGTYWRLRDDAAGRRSRRDDARHDRHRGAVAATAGGASALQRQTLAAWRSAQQPTWWHGKPSTKGRSPSGSAP